MLNRVNGPAPTVEELRWLSPRNWPSREATYRRHAGHLVQLVSPANANDYLHQRLEVAAAACRLVVAAWDARKTGKATKQEYTEIRSETQAFLLAEGVPELLLPTIWPITEKISQQCQMAIKKGEGLDKIARSVDGTHPHALSTRLIVGEKINIPVEYKDGHWRIEQAFQDLWVASKKPLTDTPKVTYGEIAKIGNGWAVRFVHAQWKQVE